MKTDFFKNEYLRFVLLLVLTALMLYYVPIIKPLFFFVIFYFFLKSKRNYFWLAYFFTVIVDVGGFFEELTDEVISIGPVTISLLFLYSIMSFIKVKRDRLKGPFFLRRNVNLWMFYLFFLMYVGLFIIGNRGGGKSGYRYFFFIFMMLPGILTLYTTYKFIPNQKVLLNFSKLIFLGVIINICGQFVHLFLGAPVYSYFVSEDSSHAILNIRIRNYQEKLVRPWWGAFHALLGIFLSIYWSIKKNHNFNRSILMLMLLISIFSIFITATRGWIIAIVLFILSVLFIMNLETKFRVLKILGIALFSFFILYSLYEPIAIQSELVLGRLTTLGDLAQGDLTAGGTNSRLTDRNAPVVELFYKRPIFGSGFSLEGLMTSDQHVGNQNTLMSGGVVGYFIIVLLWIRIVKAALNTHRESLKIRGYGGEVLLILPLLLSLLFIHSTSTSLFDYVVYLKHPSKFLSLGVIFAIMNQIIYSYNDKKVENEKQ